MTLLNHKGKPFNKFDELTRRLLSVVRLDKILKKFGQRPVFDTLFPPLVDALGKPLYRKGQKGKTIKFKRYSNDESTSDTT